MSKRYKAAGKYEKGKILQELCESSDYHRKHAIRLLNGTRKRDWKKGVIGRVIKRTLKASSIIHLLIISYNLTLSCVTNEAFNFKLTTIFFCKP